MKQGLLRSEQGESDALGVARAAARRSGLSLGEWIETLVGEANSENMRRQATRQDQGPENIRARLSEIAEHLDRLGARSDSPIARRPTASPEAPDKLASALQRLSRRLDDLFPDNSASKSFGGPPRAHPFESPPDSAAEIDRAVAEIAARQQKLDLPENPAAPITVDLSGLEQQLRQITEQIEALRRPCGAESAIAGLRQELAEIYRTINEALPRRALESLEAEVRALAQRIDAGRHGSADAGAIAGLERGLAEVRDALRALTPAENLASVSELIRTLARKVDALAANGADPAALQQIELAVSRLREVADGAASNEALSALAAEVRAIAVKVDQLLSAESQDALTKDLAARIEALSQKLEMRPAETGLPRLEHVEGHINRLLDKLEAVREPPRDLDAIERALANLAVQIGEARVSAVEAAERAARAVAREVTAAPAAGGEFDALKQDLSELRVIQAASDERTRSTLEAVHDTLEKLVDRLASLESELRRDVRDFSASSRERPMQGAPEAKRILLSDSGITLAPSETPAPKPAAGARETRPIDPTLPADHPLEPGSVAVRGRSAAADSASASERKGSAESPQKAGQTRNFIAAARRAAQAAQSLDQDKAELLLDSDDAANEPSFFARHRRPFLIGMGAFLLIVGIAHLLVNMLAGQSAIESPRPLKERPPPAANAPPRESPGPAEIVPPKLSQPASPSLETTGSTKPTQGRASPVTQSIVSTIPSAGVLGSVEPQRSSLVPAAGGSFDPDPQGAASVASSAQPASEQAVSSLASPRSDPASPTGGSDKLPATLGRPDLRAAAESGKPAAEYEVGILYAEGRGAPQSFEQAARWFERAANQGFAPAQYRLGSLYEKGQGVKKDLEAARRLYKAAAEKGNAKSMHNLAVLFAEGVEGKPDFHNAATWFRRAAERGVGDSQYNLGILYARGIGVDQNLAESYKWFALAAQQGDQEAAKKRDDVAQRIDAQSLVAAKLAVQTFTPQPQPREAAEPKTSGSGEQSGSRPSRNKPGTRKSGAV